MSSRADQASRSAERDMNGDKTSKNTGQQDQSHFTEMAQCPSHIIDSLKIGKRWKSR